jgi:hypothetical protein
LSSAGIARRVTGRRGFLAGVEPHAALDDAFRIVGCRHRHRRHILAGLAEGAGTDIAVIEQETGDTGRRVLNDHCSLVLQRLLDLGAGILVGAHAFDGLCRNGDGEHHGRGHCGAKKTSGGVDVLADHIGPPLEAKAADIIVHCHSCGCPNLADRSLFSLTDGNNPVRDTAHSVAVSRRAATGQSS